MTDFLKGFWNSPFVMNCREWVRGRIEDLKNWWKNAPIQNRRRALGWTCIGLFLLALILKMTAVLIQAAVVGVGAFMTFWILWSFAAAKWPKMDEWRIRHLGKMEAVILIGFPVLIGLSGGTLTHILGGWLAGELVSVWNMISGPEIKTEVQITA